ncbi:glycoside hydrolase family 45 protein [Mixia osmundae IAM 14324]|uniref:Expansin-like EG45 domain-containing protein n=1 Tax=Mixia osmundae (strain CBS 9802 / IAM 14324 / JCM 22182 / KY 12970) TaxID=764103 RepID=G7E1M1_MIXOS|nr:glycoside hydrolase family 45 protein [Mixia osmundae IAM 14324]KEI36681.1 glycoside hydrolase family 45 protein [Mixia osmundae IAM 14324]GAA96731.1 hypothetical protein E5Q_03402 [Mixia osmundae IAM 14324]
MISHTFVLLAVTSGSLAQLGLKLDTQLDGGWMMPSSGYASTTQFVLNDEIKADGSYGSTACGMAGWAGPGQKFHTDGPGKGPGFLYAAINQRAFGAVNGPGWACGKCYTITPISDADEVLCDQSLTFEICDLCPVGTQNFKNCGQCRGSTNTAFGQEFHFDIATDAMNAEQYATFTKGITYGSNWKKVQFELVDCDRSVNPLFTTRSWGCASGCKLNNALDACTDATTGKLVSTEVADHYSGLHKKRMTMSPVSSLDK